MMRTANPPLNAQVFQQARGLSAGDVMTLQGTVNKTFILLALLVISAAWVWGKIVQPVPVYEGMEGVGQTVASSAGPLMMLGITLFSTWRILSVVFCLIGLILGALYAEINAQRNS